MRNHSNNLIFLCSKMETSITTLVNPFFLPCHCENKRCNGISLVVKTPKLRCIGKIYSSLSKTEVIPTEIASCPIPENHF